MFRVRLMATTMAATLLGISPAIGEGGTLRADAEAGPRALTASSEPGAQKTPAADVAAAPAAAKTDAPPPRPSYAVVARINLATQQMTVSVDGAPRHSWPVSSGRSGFPTPRGTFRAQWMSRMWYSRKYDLAPMPHAVFFSGGAAIHATQATGLLGRPASHGCVRLAPGNAATFYGLVQKHGLARTQVVVFGEPPRAPALARRIVPGQHVATTSRTRVPAHGGRVPVWHGQGPQQYYQPVQQPAYNPQYSIWGAPIGQGPVYGYASSPRQVAPRAIRLR